MTETKVSPALLRLALEEKIRMGPETRRSVEERLARRSRGAGEAARAVALAQADRAVEVAAALAGEYQDHKRSQADVYAELQRRFPWLGDGDLALRLGNHGYHLVIM